MISITDIKSFANLTEDELETVVRIKEVLKLRPSGKLGIQGSAMEFDDLNVKLNDILFSLQFQLANDKLDMDTILSRYYHDKMGLYKEKELYYKFLNDTGVDSATYKALILRVDRLKAFIEHLDKLGWIIKSRVETLRIAHSTDY